MKKLTIGFVICLYCLKTLAQEVRVAEVDFISTSSSGINLAGTYGETIVQSESNTGLLIVHGFYSGVIPDSATSIRPVDMISGLHTFPNPAHSGFVLSCEDLTHSQYKVSLMSESMQFLRKWEWPAGIQAYKLELQDLPAGIYWISIVDPLHQKQTMMQVIKQ